MTSTQAYTLEHLAERRAHLREQRDQIDTQLAEIDDQIRALGIGTHDAGEWTVQVQTNRRLNTSLLEQRYPVAQHPELYKPAINTAEVKKRIAAIDLEDFYTESAPKVLVR